MNRWFNALIALFSVTYFGNILLVLLFSPSFPIGSAGGYDLALSQIFAENGDDYSAAFSSLYWTVYYVSVTLLIGGLIFLGLRKAIGIWLFIAFICLDVLVFYWMNTNTVMVAHKVLTISGVVTYPLQGAIIALYFACKKQLGFIRNSPESSF
ncbi:hypothetical protein PQU92_11680 [Asticcacaulis sp. BYS171W]|uniref:DUF4386 domain-containing protein n=1 Tax=Asticcacaulis aquaticus TaxID=2984212 RepID=A0ABT5HV62_9CAUL|nr:hypothetical protein [Asticcacaulis aquaticus]MDC7683939.1 hypothetical protein [Asticcacaulis aquaticus]